MQCPPLVRRGAAAALVTLLLAAACGSDDSTEAASDAGSSDTSSSDTGSSEAGPSEATASPVSEHTSAPSTSDDAIDHEGDDHEHGDGAGEEIPADGAPTVDFEAALTEDTQVELTILTTGFELVGEGEEPTGTEPYAGHAHVIVGETTAMIYADRYTLSLPPGENEVRVELGNVDHLPFLVDGEVIHVTKMVHVPETPDADFHTHEVEGDHDH